MIHKDNIDKYNGSMDDLIEDIGNLKYDALSDFLMKLSEKIEKDGNADFKRKRFKLAKELKQASVHINNAWIISKPFMP